MLKEKILQLIKHSGPIEFDRFMALALLDKESGYYKVKSPLGSRGDFITSPELSQVFGELIGLWLLDCWHKLKSPQKFHLVEIGAGSGSLLSDILRATKMSADFHRAMQVEIIEVNQELRKLQQQKLHNYQNISWVERVEDLTINAPVLIYSNEFFDALPVKQFLYENNKWFELVVDINPSKDKFQLSYMKIQQTSHLKSIRDDYACNSNYFIYETSPVANSIFSYLLNLIKENNGLILTIDYGYNALSFSNSIRGFKKHKLVDIFELINEVPNIDLTYNVNFLELINLAQATNISTYKLITQQFFLENLGIKARANVLLQNIRNKKEQEDFYECINMLISPKEMGDKYKVMLVSKGISSPAVFVL